MQFDKFVRNYTTSNEIRGEKMKRVWENYEPNDLWIRKHEKNIDNIIRNGEGLFERDEQQNEWGMKWWKMHANLGQEAGRQKSHCEAETPRHWHWEDEWLLPTRRQGHLHAEMRKETIDDATATKKQTIRGEIVEIESGWIRQHTSQWGSGLL